MATFDFLGWLLPHFLGAIGAQVPLVSLVFCACSVAGAASVPGLRVLSAWGQGTVFKILLLITYSTVGFGDFTPDTKAGRIFSCVVMVLGVVAFFNVVSAVADVIAETQRFYKRQLRLSLSGFARIDRDGTGEINKTESGTFRSFCLKCFSRSLLSYFHF